MKMKENFIYKNKQKAEEVKKRRLFNRIYNLIQNKDSQFLTMTFNDKILSKANEETRLRYIKKYLNNYCEEYILNCDYGKENEREHYHAIIRPKYKIVDYSKYRYGYIKGELIHKMKRYQNANKSLYKTAERLTNHAIKETNKKGKIYYSRKPQKPINSQILTDIDFLLFMAEEQRQIDEYERQRLLELAEEEEKQRLEKGEKEDIKPYN